MDYKTQGKKNRAAGARFEAKVREDLEKQGWIVTRWMNQVDLEKEKLVPAKSNVFGSRTTGFPDFIILRRKEDGFEVIGVEVKMNKYLDPEERKKCRWYLKNKIFDSIIIASKPKRGEILYEVKGIKHFTR